MSSNTPSLKCPCGATINLLVNTKVRINARSYETECIMQSLADLGTKAEEATVHLEKQELEKAHVMFNDYLTSLDKLLVPPYQDYYKVQQNIWKLAWMRWGNKIVTNKRMGVRKQNDVDLD
jgi:hypothetical protein